MVLGGTFARVVKQLRTLGTWAATLERASGIVILGVGLYFLWIAQVQLGMQ
jgi:cytochrome c biogenesis protein CcdA